MLFQNIVVACHSVFLLLLNRTLLFQRQLSLYLVPAIFSANAGIGTADQKGKNQALQVWMSRITMGI
jgi:hypothetical protein